MGVFFIYLYSHIFNFMIFKIKRSSFPEVLKYRSEGLGVLQIGGGRA